MSSTISSIELLTLFGVMLILAAIPGVSVLTVVSRTASHGISHGFAATLGIVTGDIIFILIAILGLTLIAEILGDAFIWLRYIGAAYLIWLGIQLWRDHSSPTSPSTANKTSHYASYIAGFMVTIADQKAVLFYLGFFPAFIDLSSVSTIDMVKVILIALLAISIAKLGYAYLAIRSVSLLSGNRLRWINQLASSLLILVGLFLLLSTLQISALHTPVVSGSG